MRTGPFSKFEHQSGSQIECQVRFSLRTVLKIDAGFQSASEKSSTLVAPPQMRAKFCPSSPEKKTLVSRRGPFSHCADAAQLVQTLTSHRARCRLLWHLAWPPQAPPDRIFSFWAIFCISQRGKQGFCTVQEVPKR
jgi:hypothetical protein